MSVKRPHSPDVASTERSNHGDNGSSLSKNQETILNSKIFKSSIIKDRSSDFIAIFSPFQPITTSSTKQLQGYPQFKSASHRILAWRKPSQQTRISLTTSNQNQKLSYVTGSDDDDEKYAGSKLEKLLNSMEIVGTVVVARWYGGILLGPIRFKHIEDAAREAILQWKNSLNSDGTGGIGGDEGGSEKRRKLDSSSIQGGGIIKIDETELISKLARSLSERDKSIIVLRDMLAEKQRSIKDGDSKENIEDEKLKSQQSSSSSPEKKGPDYGTMPLLRLRQLEKARDATIAWILKELDKLEECEKDLAKDNSGIKDSQKEGISLGLIDTVSPMNEQRYT